LVANSGYRGGPQFCYIAVRDIVSYEVQYRELIHLIRGLSDPL